MYEGNGIIRIDISGTDLHYKKMRQWIISPTAINIPNSKTASKERQKDDKKEMIKVVHEMDKKSIVMTVYVIMKQNPPRPTCDPTAPRLSNAGPPLTAKSQSENVHQGSSSV